MSSTARGSDLRPRLSPSLARQRRRVSSSPGATRTRTSHACDRCRLMRTKCSGGVRCSKCVRDDTVCAYGDRKRERNKKDLAESLDRVSLLERENKKLVQALRAVVDAPETPSSQRSDLLEVLAKHVEQVASESGPETSLSQSRSRSSPKMLATDLSQGPASGEATAASSVGSPGHLGELSQVVDLNHGSGASGFVGKMSEIAWLKRGFEYLRHHPDKTPRVGNPDKTPLLGALAVDDYPSASSSNYSYWMDDINVLAVDEDQLNPFQWPSVDYAIILTEAYFHAIHGVFPLLVRGPFLRAMLAFARRPSLLAWPQRQWLATVNLVWAIAAKWLQITKLDYADASYDHLLFYARARALGLDHRVMSDHPDIERVQGIALLAFYLLVNGSINRAWNTLGHATRHATALGLHLRVTDPGLSERDHDQRVRTWFSLYSLEVLIAEITGRPKSLSWCTMTNRIDMLRQPLWEEVDDPNSVDTSPGPEPNYVSPHQSKTMWLDYLRAARNTPQAMTGGQMPWRSFAAVGLGHHDDYFSRRLALCRLSDRIADDLYSTTATRTWAQVQDRIGVFQAELQHWFYELPDDLSVQSQSAVETDPRVRLELSMYYHSVQMMLHRLCLCEIVIEHESVASQEFNRSSARACVHAAMSMLAMMPDNPSAHEAYQLLPWWTLLHYLCQATAVLLLELCTGLAHFKDEQAEVMNYVRKAMLYLWCMAEDSLSAYRAWRICRQLLSEVSTKFDGMDTVDIPAEAPRPVAWTDDHEHALRISLLVPDTPDV